MCSVLKNIVCLFVPFLFPIVLSVLQHLVTPLLYSDCIVCPSTSGYPFGVFRLYCLSFYLQLLVTPLLYSDCIVCPSTSGYPFGVFRLYCLSFYLQLLVTPLLYSDYCLSFDLQLLVTPLVYSDCIVCPSIYNFWLPLWCIQTVLSVLLFTTSDILLWCIQTVLSVLQFTTSDYPFGVFRLHCLSFDLQLLVTPLVYSDCIVCPLIYNFWLPLWCIQTVLSVLRFTTSGYPFGVFKLYCLSFDLQLLVTLWCIQTVLSVLLFTTSGYPFGVFRLLSVLRFTTSGYSFGVFRLYCLFFDLQLLVTPFMYSDCNVCPSIYNFWLPFWCIQTVLSVLLFTTSGYPFGVFRLYCLSFDLQLLVTPFVYSDCNVCPSIYNFWLPFWCIQTVLSVLLFTTSDYPFGVFRLYCLSLDLQLLVTPLVYSDCIVCPSIYNFWLPLWCIQTVCLSFYLQLLITPLVYSNCIVYP